jgi:hypothetical protein
MIISYQFVPTIRNQSASRVPAANIIGVIRMDFAPVASCVTGASVEPLLGIQPVEGIVI